MIKYLLYLYVVLSLCVSSAQEFALPDDLPLDFVFIKGLSGKPTLVTQKAFYTLENKWVKTVFKNILSKKDSAAIYSSSAFNNKTFSSIILNDYIHLVLNGGGFVLRLANDELKRIDNSVDQKNQISGAVFAHNGLLHLYGGYGFWKFKNYISYFDSSTGQWEYLITKSATKPTGRWKTIYQVIDNKLFVLGGRGSLKSKNSIDALLHDYFIYDFKSKTFKGEELFNSEIPIKTSNNKGFLFRGMKAHARQNELLVVDFLKQKITQISSKKLFKTLNYNHPIFESQDTLYYISGHENQKRLSKLAVSALLSFKNKTYPIKIQEKNTNFYFLSFITLSTVLVGWLLYGLFSYKDFIKEFILFDENKLYFRGYSAHISSSQYNAVLSLSFKGVLSSLELNEIISPKNKFVKSHLTLLRQNFIKELNDVFNKLTKARVVYIEELKDPSDRRFLTYRAAQEVLKKPSFVSFLFKYRLPYEHIKP